MTVNLILKIFLKKQTVVYFKITFSSYNFVSNNIERNYGVIRHKTWLNFTIIYLVKN